MESFEKLYIENVKGIYGFLFKLCKDADLSEELTQECFFQAYLSLHRFQGNCAMFTWLAAIAKNVYFRYLRKHRCCPISYESMADELSDGIENPEENALKRECNTKLRAIIMGMKPKYRDVILLRIYAGLPFSQVAGIMNITENSAKVIFFRAKEIIKEEIKREDLL